MIGRAGGALLCGLIDPHQLGHLQAEACQCHQFAQEARAEDRDPADAEAGDPSRWLESAPGGPVLRDLFHAASTRAFLDQVTGRRCAPLGEQGSYSYYRSPDHFLGLHRDIEGCDVALITCISDVGGNPASCHGLLRIYPSRARESIAQIEADPARGVVHVRVPPSESLVCLGHLVPHGLVQLAPGQVRIVAPLCYEFVDQ